jgi:hypothetical protein
LQSCQNFAKRSREWDQVINSIFELKVIHVREVAYKRSELFEDNLEKHGRWSFRCQNEVMCGGQEMWSKAEYNKMIQNRVEHIGKIKDVAECRSHGSRDWSQVIGVPEVESVVRWHRVGESRT